MATLTSSRLGSLALRSLNLAKRPLVRGMASDLRPNVLAHATRVPAAKSMPAHMMGAGRVLVTQRACMGAGTARFFASSPHSQHDHDSEKSAKRVHEHDAHSMSQESKSGDKEAAAVSDNKPQSFWRRMLNVRQWGLTEVGTAATILCAIDCTVFPVVLTALPLAQLMDPATSHHIAHMVHGVALYFVLPIGSLAVGTNFAQHKRFDIAGLGAAGVLTIAAAHLSVLPEWVTAYQAWLNTAGCAGLLASGWLSHRVLHQHGHDHGHGHSHCHGTSHCSNKTESKQGK